MSYSIHDLQIPLTDEQVKQIIDSLRTVYETVDEGDLSIILTKKPNGDMYCQLLRNKTAILTTKEILEAEFKKALDAELKTAKELAELENKQKKTKINIIDLMIVFIFLAAAFLLINEALSAIS